MKIDQSPPQIPTFNYRDEDFKELFSGFDIELSKSEKDQMVYHFMSFMSKEIQKELNRMVRAIKKMNEKN